MKSELQSFTFEMHLFGGKQHDSKGGLPIVKFEKNDSELSRKSVKWLSSSVSEGMSWALASYFFDETWLFLIN